MRTCGSTIQQALTTESLDIVRQSIISAKRRGHAQVTPLHVANTLLSNSTGILRTACLQSRSHPLHCRALELCFNVALNRLPASNSGPMLGLNSTHPSISNALVAALKRAQAHQRRGSSVESQQQSVLAVKIESEQLVISILDDPSVSRVMREAGFSSVQVKSSVEQAFVSSLEMSSTCQSSRSTSPVEKAAQGKPVGFELDPVRNDDVLALHPVTTIHTGSSLQLSLPSHDRSRLKCHEYNSSNKVEKGTDRKLQLLHDHEKQMNCYQGCSVNFQIEKAQSFQNNASSDQALPPWFQQYKNEKKRFPTTEQHVWMSEITEKHVEPSLRMFMPEPPNSASANDSMDTESDHTPNFKQLNPENITFLCNTLEKKIPWQRSIVPEIATTILQCRSGNMVTRKRKRKQDTWLLFQGADAEAKEKVARELACLVSGSEIDNFVSIGSSTSFSCRRSKRSRVEEQSNSSYIDRFAEAVCFNPHRVFFIEDVDQADNWSLMGFKRASERGRIGKPNGEEEVELGDAIVVLSSNHILSDGFSEDSEKSSSRLSLDLNVSVNDVYRLVDDDVRLLEFVDRRIVFRCQDV